MKKLLSALISAALLVMIMGVPAFAAEEPGLLISPAPDAEAQQFVSVLANGEYVTFPDAQP